MTRGVHALEGNRQRLDGGAMFGNAPRPMWERLAKPDEHHRIPLACRSMLVVTDTRCVLFETGIGSFFSPPMRERFGVVESHHVLLDELARQGLRHEDVDTVVLSHLHFDHAGGLLAPYEDGAPPRLLFPRARFLVSRAAYARACNPHPRDRASYIPELPGLLDASGRLEILDRDRSPNLPGVRFHASEGHTPGLLLAEVETNEGPLVFGADLIPGVPWVHLPITMGYDRFPERVVDEKTTLLEDLLSRGGSLFFTHDPDVASGRVTRDAKGRFGIERGRAQLSEVEGRLRG